MSRMTSRVLAYLLRAQDNNSYMLGEETRKAATDEERAFFDWRFMKDGQSHPATCAQCGRKTDSHFVDPAFKLRKKGLDIGATYDGYTIVSDRFKDACERLGLGGLEFRPLPSVPTHHWLVVQPVLDVDIDQSEGLRFLYHCDLCQQHAGVFGTVRLRFKGLTAPIPNGIFRTDLSFGQAHEQSPLTVLGTETCARLKAEPFKGIRFEAIHAP